MATRTQTSTTLHLKSPVQVLTAFLNLTPYFVGIYRLHLQNRKSCPLFRNTGSRLLVMLLKKKLNQSHYRPGQAQRVFKKLRFLDFVTTAQDGGRLSALRTGRLSPQQILWYSFLLQAESTPEP